MNYNARLKIEGDIVQLAPLLRQSEDDQFTDFLDLIYPHQGNVSERWGSDYLTCEDIQIFQNLMCLNLSSLNSPPIAFCLGASQRFPELTFMMMYEASDVEGGLFVCKNSQIMYDECDQLIFVFNDREVAFVPQTNTWVYLDTFEPPAEPQNFVRVFIEQVNRHPFNSFNNRIYQQQVAVQALVPFLLIGDNNPFSLINEDTLCSICLGEPHDPVITPCNHSFCRTCILPWIESQSQQHSQTACPVCRQRLQ